MNRLPESLLALYAELLDQAIQAEAEAVARGLPPPGSFVSKEVKGRTYWYLQRLEAGRRRQYYIGPDSASLQGWMDGVARTRESRRPDEDRRAELVAMLVAGGATGEQPAIARVLRVLAEAGVFRLGAVLVGTQAFTCYSNLLGARFEDSSYRTFDVDVAQDPAIPVALDLEAVPAPIEELLQRADGRFLAVPALDARQPSTAFKVRGRDLRVDLLTPGRSDGEGPVRLPHLDAAAQPLPFLDYLVAAPEAAVVLDGAGLLVNVPSPARFALHKLWVAQARPAAQQAKARKDLRQAEELVAVLFEDRRRDLERAWRAVPSRRRRAVLAGAEMIAPEVERMVREVAR